MKKNKIIKRKVKSKNNYFKYAAMFLLVAFAAVGVSQVLGFEINKDTPVCMDKKGNLFVPLDKKGNIDSCGKHGDAITFKFDGGSGSGGGNMVGDGTGYIRFVDGVTVLAEDGTLWSLSTGSWQKVNYSPIDSNIVDKITFWTMSTFLTDTEYYRLNYNHPSGIPTYESVALPTPTI